MKRRFLIPVMLALASLAFVSTSTGCASQTPVMTAADAHDVYNATLSGLVEARRAGLITDTQKAQIEQVRAPVYDAIIAMDQAALADNRSGFASALKQYKVVLPAFRKFLLQYTLPQRDPLAAVK